MKKSILISRLLLLILILIPLTNADIGVTYNSTTKIYDLYNDYHHFYINSTSGFQMSNVPEEWWSHNLWCLQVKVGGNWVEKCTDSFSWTWTNYTGSNFVQLNGTTIVTYGPATIGVKVVYGLSDSDSRMKITPYIKNLGPSGEARFVYRIHDIKINNTPENDWGSVLYDGEVLEGRLNNTNLNQSFTNLTERWYHLYDSVLDGWARTWWDENATKNGNPITNFTYNLSVWHDGLETNAHVDLIVPLGMMSTNDWVSTNLWWEDDICSSTCSLTNPTSQQNIYKGQTFGMSVYFTTTCTGSKSVQANFNNGTTQKITSTTNLSTSNTNPKSFCFLGTCSWTITGKDNWDGVNMYYVQGHCTVGARNYDTGTQNINVTIPSAMYCTNKGTSVSLSSDSEDCYNLTANGLTINCNGHKLYSGTYPWTTEAITTNGRNNTIIKNCIFENFSQGIVASGGGNLSFFNNTFISFNRSTTGQFYDVIGIKLTNANNASIINNTMYDFAVNRNSQTGGGHSYGIKIATSNNTVIRNLTAYNFRGDYSSGGGDPTIDKVGYFIFQDTVRNVSISFSSLRNATYGIYSMGTNANVSITDMNSNDMQAAINARSSGINVDRMNITGNNLPYGSITTNGILLSSSATYMNVSNIRITNVSGDCLFVGSECNNFRGENLTFTNCSNYGIYGYGEFLSIRNATINKTGEGFHFYEVAGATVDNFIVDNYTNYGVYMESVQTDSVWSNGTFIQGASPISSIYMYKLSSTNYFLNVTANWENSSAHFGSQNYTVQEYIRFNITDQSGSPLTATISANDTFGRQEYSGYVSVSPFTPLNLTTWNFTGTAKSNYSWSNYTITANRTGYLDNTTFWNFTNAKDWTISITLYKVYMILPVITFVYPTPGHNTNISQDWVYVNISSNQNLSNALLNFSNTWYQMTYINETVWYFNMTGLTNGSYNYTVCVNDTSDNYNCTEIRNVTVDTASPAVTFVYPTPATNSNLSQTWTFINVTTNEHTTNASVNFNGTWHYMLQYNWTSWYMNITSLGDGVYIYNVSANDTANNTGISETRNITIDTVPPVLTWIGTTPVNNSIQNSTNSYYNITSNEALSSCLIYFDLTWVIMDKWNDTNWYHSIIGLAEGEHIFYAVCNDTANNTGTSETRNFTVDIVPPVLNYVYPTPLNNDIKTVNWTYINITSNEPLLNASLVFNSSTYYMMQLNSTSWYYNLSILYDGLYTYYVSGNDTANNYITLETRNVSVELRCHQINTSETFTSNRYKCQNVTSNNVVVDCNGFKVDSNWTDYVGIHGFYVYSKTNVTIKNCLINQTVNGIIIDSGSDNYIFNNTLSNIKTYGFSVNGTASDISLHDNYQSLVGTNGYNIRVADGLIIENETIHGTASTTYGIYIETNPVANTGCFNNYRFKNITIKDVTSSCLQLEPAVNPCSFDNFSLSNCSIGIYIQGLSNSVFSNGSIFSNTNYDVYSRTLIYIQQNVTLINTTFAPEKLGFSNSNVTVKWYSRVNTTNMLGNPVLSTINDTDNQSYVSFYGYQSLTAYYISNDSIYGDSGALSYNKHYIIANITQYITNITLFNVSYRDATINLTLYVSPPPLISFIFPTPDDNTTLYVNSTVINVSIDKPVTICQINWNGTIYGMIQTNSTNWYAPFSDLLFGNYTYNVTCMDEYGSSNISETRRVEISSIPPSYIFIYLNIWTNQTYYDVGDTVLLWTNLTKNLTYNTVFIYASDGSIFPMDYAPSNEYWYAYWKIRQPEDYIIVQAFSSSGNITAYGEMLIKYNPMKSSPSWYDGILLTLTMVLVPLIFGGILLLGVVLFFYIIKGRIRPATPKGPTNAATPYKHQVGVVGSGMMGSLNNVRNMGSILTQLVFLIFTILMVFVILFILYYLGHVFHII